MADVFEAQASDTNGDGKPENINIKAMGKSLKWFYITLIIIAGIIAISYTLVRIFGA